MGLHLRSMVVPGGLRLGLTAPLGFVGAKPKPIKLVPTLRGLARLGNHRDRARSSPRTLAAAPDARINDGHLNDGSSVGYSDGV